MNERLFPCAPTRTETRRRGELNRAAQAALFDIPVDVTSPQVCHACGGTGCSCVERGIEAQFLEGICEP